MVQLLDSDIKTRDVLDWKGIHLIHYMGSSCSQKVRIFLNLKGIDWESHTIDLLANENVEPWFLGINPRGLAPVLVQNGAVHIESNDIIQHLEKMFPEPCLIPAGHDKKVAALLKHEDDLHQHEDDLHLDLRTLSFRFVLNPPGPPKTSEQLKKYRTNGSGMVRGQKDGDRDIQLEWWERAAKEGYTDERTRAAAQKFRAEFEALENTLAQHPYLLGRTPSRNSVRRLRHRQSSMPTSRPRARLKRRPAKPWRSWQGYRRKRCSTLCHPGDGKLREFR
jgi:glutathione S-transferase